MPCALALLLAILALARTSASVRQGLLYGTVLGACVWAVPFGMAALFVRV